MTSFFDKLNLRPQERRLVVVVGLLVFVLLNMWFVWPFFDEWGKVQGNIAKNRRTLEKYEREVGRKAQYQAQQKELESTGSEMLSNDVELQRIVQSQAAGTGVQISSLTAVKGSGAVTNQFFQEQTLSVQFSSGGKEIVDFLVGVAAGNSMVRVRDMNLRPDPGQTKLGGTIMFVGNYQRPATNTTVTPPGAAAAQRRKT